MTKGRQKREKWFSLGVEALRRIAPDELPDGYICPLCYPPPSTPITVYLPESLEAGLLTLEDVPPKSVGGKPMVLTCSDCNNTSGYKLDAHLARMTNMLKFGTKTLSSLRRGRVKFGEVTANILYRWENGRLEITDFASGKRNSPTVAAAINGILDRAVKGHGDWSFNLDFVEDRFDSQMAMVSLLRSAYLCAFASFGYRFIVGRSLDPVRDQIRHPDRKILPYYGAVLPDTRLEDRGIGVIDEPSWLQGIGVQIGFHFIVLPRFSDDFSFYNRIVDSSTQNIRMTRLPWPKAPTFACDFDDSLFRHLLCRPSGAK
jgi:hypothetical protein